MRGVRWGVAQRSGRSSGDNWKRQQQRTATWEAAERKRQAKESARQAQQDHLIEQQERATSLTHEVASRLAELTGILHAALDAQAAPIDLTPDSPVLDLGADNNPSPAPDWTDCAWCVAAPTPVGRVVPVGRST